MKISAFSNPQIRSKNNISFKAIYLEDNVKLGKAAPNSFPAEFSERDALLLNEIAQRYPNQDCFIRKGYGGYPKLEFRERPIEVQSFTTAKTSGRKKIDINTYDERYPCVPLILKGDSPINRIIGVPSNKFNKPSLAYTIQAGFELHKEILKMKQELTFPLGSNDKVDLGSPTEIWDRSVQSVKGKEIAVTRYLLEQAYSTLSKKITASELYKSDFYKVQQALKDKRQEDLVTSVIDQRTGRMNKLLERLENSKSTDTATEIREDVTDRIINESISDPVDICKAAESVYGSDFSEESNKELCRIMIEKGLIL